MQNGVVSVGLTAATNRVVTKSYIDKNWKLEDWNEKMWMLESQFCIFTFIKRIGMTQPISIV